MNYPEVTFEQKEALEALLWCDRMELTAGADGYRLKAIAEYEFPHFTEGISFLSGMRQAAEILGCAEGDEAERQQTRQGCETCDYGSRYETEWRFWSPAP